MNKHKNYGKYIYYLQRYYRAHSNHEVWREQEKDKWRSYIVDPIRYQVDRHLILVFSMLYEAPKR